ncbi:MAG: hypothetical protein LBO66_14610 [Deltaproteobacteria bacterium]|nr:hypothetical protein [Deltaproteobacteria bacterium]
MEDAIRREKKREEAWRGRASAWRGEAKLEREKTGKIMGEEESRFSEEEVGGAERLG